MPWGGTNGLFIISCAYVLSLCFCSLFSVSFSLSLSLSLSLSVCLYPLPLNSPLCLSCLLSMFIALLPLCPFVSLFLSCALVRILRLLVGFESSCAFASSSPFFSSYILTSYHVMISHGHILVPLSHLSLSLSAPHAHSRWVTRHLSSSSPRIPHLLSALLSHFSVSLFSFFLCFFALLPSFTPTLR